jgi:methionyl-tRNA formyltransferase
VRLIFFGTGSFALPALQRLAPHLILVVSQPDRPTGRGLRFQPAPAKQLAQELGIPCQTPEKSRAPEFVETLRSLQADALVVGSYGQILSTAVLESAARGGINLHGSILPAYRGAAPIQRCLLDGRSETGVTLMQMDKGMDTGDIIDIARTRIDPDETYGELQDRLAEIAADLAEGWMPRIVAGEYPREPQNPDLATIAPKVTREETELKVTNPAQDEYNRFRAFTPSPGTFLVTRTGTLKVWRARLCPASGDPGTVAAIRDGLVISFAHAGLELLEVQPEGKKRMPGRDFANGARLKTGERLV